MPWGTPLSPSSVDCDWPVPCEVCIFIQCLHEVSPAAATAVSMGPAPVAMSVSTGRALFLNQVAVRKRAVLQASVREREPIGERVINGSKSSTDPKDLLQELQRLREQRARLRADLTSKEKSLRARAVEGASEPQHSGTKYSVGPIESGDDGSLESPENASCRLDL